MESYEVKQKRQTKHGEGIVVLVKQAIKKDRYGYWENFKNVKSKKSAGVIVDAIIELENGFVIQNLDSVSVGGKQKRVLWESEFIPK